jgi:hypothetical protein
MLKLFVYGGTIMDAMREAWTDERLDDLNDRVGELGRRMDDGFNRVHEDIRALDAKIDLKIDALRSEMSTGIDRFRAETKTESAALRAETKIESAALRAETKTEFAAVRAEIASLHRLMVQLTGGVILTIVATQIAERL